MNAFPVLVAHYSWHWIQVAVESYLRHFPGERILVVDNNPRRGEVSMRPWVPDCARERDWLASHPGVILIDNPAPPDGMHGQRSHGAGMDLALAWCREQGVEAMVHFEPDCLVTGRLWRDNLLGALDRSAWMAGGCRQSHGTIHPTPSAWLVAAVRASFQVTPWAGPDQDHPRFRELINPAALEHDDDPVGKWIHRVSHWDTGHKAWFEAAIRDRAALVPTPDLRHYWHGSWILRYSEETLAARCPELQPYLEQARQRRKPLPVEQCPFRDALPGGGATCRLVQEVSGVKEAARCAVSWGTCQACRGTFFPAPDAPNPVVASLLYGLGDEVLGEGGVPGCSAAEAAELQKWVEPSLDLELP